MYDYLNIKYIIQVYDMNLLLYLVVIPIAVIIFSIALQKILKCPWLVALIFFAIFLLVAFLVSNLNLSVYGIIYALLAFITASIVCLLCRIRCGNGLLFNTINARNVNAENMTSNQLTSRQLEARNIDARNVDANTVSADRFIKNNNNDDENENSTGCCCNSRGTYYTCTNNRGYNGRMYYRR